MTQPMNIPERANIPSAPLVSGASRLAWQRKRRAMQIRESMEEIDINIRCDDRRAVAVG